MSTIRLTEAAVILRMPYHQVHRMALIGELEARLVNGRWRVSEAAAKKLAQQLVSEKRERERVEGRGSR